MKKIINIIFIVAVCLTIAMSLLLFLRQPNDDIFYNTLDRAAFLIMLTPVLILETEIYRMCVYVFTKGKRPVNTFLRIFSLFAAVLLSGLLLGSFYTTSNNWEMFFFAVLIVYVLLKAAGLFCKKV